MTSGLPKSQKPAKSILKKIADIRRILREEGKPPRTHVLEGLERLNDIEALPPSVEWSNYPAKQKDIMWKHSNDAISWHSILIVKEHEAAAVFRDGKVYDVFATGRHVLGSTNLPLLTEAIKPFGNLPLRATVFFVSTREIAGEFDASIQTKDDVPLIVKGRYGFKVIDPGLFLKEFSDLGKFTTEEVMGFLRSHVSQNATKVLASYSLDTLFRERLDVTSSKAKEAIKAVLVKFGIELEHLHVQNIATMKKSTS